MKKILGLDLGTNSIGWAVLNEEPINDNKSQLTGIDCAGSRIIPMDAAVLGDFDRGNSISQTAERTRLRGNRRLIERSHLRRARLNRVLMEMKWLPEHYSKCLDRYGNFINDQEPRIAWKPDTNGRYEFMFMESFREMLSEFESSHSELIKNGLKVPHDWTVYYLRKKALTRPISKYELAWILHNFNQKRGYSQLREDDDLIDKSGKKIEYYSLRVSDVIAEPDEKNGKGQHWYTIVLDNGWSFRRTFNLEPDWKGKIKDFIVTTSIDKKGNAEVDKEGNVKRSFRSPDENDWTLIKKKTEADIENSHMTVGEFIYDALLRNPSQKIRGKFVRTIERKYYRNEIQTILDKQKEFHEELCDDSLYERCVNLLYDKNESHRRNISGKGLSYLFINDIIFYQRPLKSKKSLIGNCPYESRIYIDPTTKEKHVEYIKCIAKSHPLFQEFRLLQFISNLRIFQIERVVDGKTFREVDITADLLPNHDSYAELYEWLDEKDKINMKDLLSCPVFRISKKEISNFRWNFPTDKVYSGNETRCNMLKYLSKVGLSKDFLSSNIEERLWHLLYSITTKEELQKGLEKFAIQYNISDTELFVQTFVKFPPFKKEYGSYSAKAIKRLLPLMRHGKFWKEDSIDPITINRISKIISGEYDPGIQNKARDKAVHLKNISDFQGLPLWLACYVVYNRHSESMDGRKWDCPEDIDMYLASFRQHSLHNPIVEQVVLETLRTVRDIWGQVGHIDEIHVELGREMKNPADKRRKIAEQIRNNEITNLRIKSLLAEFINPKFEIDGVRPNSPYQQDLLKIYEESVIQNVEIDKDIEVILKKFNETDIKKQPTSSEILKYKLWLDQKYRSPYTGAVIPLGKLFTPAYEIEHIIPQKRYFDDSLSNKVICESEVNKLKDTQLAHEFIQEHGGQIVTLNYGKTVTILTVEEYEKLVKDEYGHNRAKMQKLLLDDIPEEFVQRQLNDSRYISKLMKSLLSNIVREDGENEAISKNVITCTGAVTDKLKKDWGVNHVWNDIILPRFSRMEQIDPSHQFTAYNANGKLIPSMPLVYQKGFNKKRIDHRHHAMDAVVIACANRNIVNYLNNVSACGGARISRYDLRNAVCHRKIDENGNSSWVVNIPWENFVVDLRKVLSEIIVSFKQNLRVINKTTNYYLKYDDSTGRKEYVRQEKGDSWAIRKPLHKDTVFGKVNLRRSKSVLFITALSEPQRIVDRQLKSAILKLKAAGKTNEDIKAFFKQSEMRFKGKDISRVEVYYYSEETKERYYASRIEVSELSEISPEKISDAIESITDTGIQRILKLHLKESGNKPAVAFSQDGIDRLNANIVELNGGKRHEPILKVRKYEKADKFPVGERGCRSQKYVEAAKGTNLFFAVYKSGNSRSFVTIPLNRVIDNLKSGYPAVPEVNPEGERLLFSLSPNDLVYVPTMEELDNGIVSLPLNRERIYKMVSCTGTVCHFIPAAIASPVIQILELGSNNKSQKSWSGEMIKNICIPIKVDRLGNVIGFDPGII